MTRKAKAVASDEALGFHDFRATFAPAPVPRPPLRRISAELVKAETKLLALERRRRQSAEHHECVWAEKRAALIKSFPADVLAALEAMAVLEGEEIEALHD